MKDGTPKITDFGLVKFTAPRTNIRQHMTMAITDLDFHLSRMAKENRELMPASPECDNLDELVETMAQSCVDRTGLSAGSIDLVEVQKFLTTAQEVQSDNLEPDVFDVQAKTQMGDVMGSPPFMSPEQAKGQIQKIGIRTDVYGLGATLYKILTNQPPALGNSVMEVLGNVLNTLPAPPVDLDHRIPVELSDIVMRSIDKDPDKRHSSMNAFASDLKRLLDSPVLESQQQQTGMFRGLLEAFKTIFPTRG